MTTLNRFQGGPTENVAVLATPTKVKHHEYAVFFDLDNTLIRGSSLFWLVRFLRQKGIISTRDLTKIARHQAQFRIQGKETEGLIERAKEHGLALVNGKKASDLIELSEDFYTDFVQPQLWEKTVALALDHVQAGAAVYIVTASPQHVAQVIAENLGFNGALGTSLVINSDGYFTGETVAGLLHGPAKAAAVSDIAIRHGYRLDDCYAYSDSINDLPLLSLVGHPVAINPDPVLRKYAKDNDWPVHDFRTGRKAAKHTGMGIAALATTGATVAVGMAAAKKIQRHRDEK